MTASKRVLEKHFLTAVRRGDLEAVNACLTNNVDINLRDKFSNTPVMLAAWRGHPETLKVLLVAGGSIDLQDNNGWTALMSATFYEKVETVSILLANGASINLQNNNGKTAVDIAIEEGYHAIATAIQAEIEKRALTKTATPTLQQPKKVKL